MTPPRATTPPDFSAVCAQAIYLAKTNAATAGHPFLLSDVAGIIRLHCRAKAARRPARAPGPVHLAPIPAPPNPFGDRHVIPPPHEHVVAYSASIGWPLDGDAFCDFYARKGWMVGRTKMKDWQAACRYAKRETFTFGGPKKAQHAPANEDYTSI